jgi:exonuclease SbcC
LLLDIEKKMLANKADCATVESQIAQLGDARRQRDLATLTLARKETAQLAHDALQKQVAELSATIARGEAALAEYDGLDEEMKRREARRAALFEGYRLYISNEGLAQRYDEIEGEYQRALLHANLAISVEVEAIAVKGRASELYHAAQHVDAKRQLETDVRALAQGQATHAAKRFRLAAVEMKLIALRGLQAELSDLQTHSAQLNQATQTLEMMRGWLKAAGPLITKRLVANISHEASQFYADIMDLPGSRLQWGADYELILELTGMQRAFRQLSGGEQMIAALALRLALLRYASSIDIAFFDEPTVHLDQERRDNLAERLMQVRGFRQMFVISHDDTFEKAADNYIRVIKGQDGSTVASDLSGEAA